MGDNAQRSHLWLTCIKDDLGYNAVWLYTHRSPMMALGVTDHIWSVEEMATYQTMTGH